MENRNKPSEDDSYQNDFLMKTIRAEEFGNLINLNNFNTKSWRYMAYGLTISGTEKEQFYKFRRPARAKDLKKKFKITVQGIKQTGMDSMWAPKHKEYYSKQTPVTYVSPEAKYFPKALDFDRKGIGVGIGISPKLALIQRISLDDLNSYFYDHMYATEEDAKAAQHFVKDFKDIPKKRGKTRIHNEIHARIRFDPDPAYQCKILVTQNNIESCLLAQIRARDLMRRLHKQFQEMKREFPTGYTVPIGFYFISEGPHTYRPYLAVEQKTDLDATLQIAESDPNSRASGLARFLALENKSFDFDMQPDSFTLEQLKIIIKEAASMTYETGILFYENFFLKNKDVILKQLTDSNQMPLLADIFNCVPLERRQELIVNRICDTPNMRTYYLFSLMNMDNLEHDKAELIMRLNAWNPDQYESPGKGPDGDSLYAYAIKHFLFDVADLLTSKDPAKDNSIESLSQTLFSAIKEGKTQAAKEILKRWPETALYADPTDAHTPLHWAVLFGNYEITQAMLNNKDNKSEDQKSAINELMSKKNKAGQDFFHALADKINQTLKNKRMGDVNAWLQLVDASMLEKFPQGEIGDLCRQLFKAKQEHKQINLTVGNYILYGDTAACSAIRENDVKTIKALIDAKADLYTPNTKQDSPASLAVEIGHLEILEALISGGVKLNQVHKKNQAREDFFIELTHKIYLACTEKKVSEVNAWLQVVDASMVDEFPEDDIGNACWYLFNTKQSRAPIDLSLLNHFLYGDTPACSAARENDVKTIENLTEAKADLYALNEKHMAPAAIAAELGNKEVLQALYSAGVDLNETTGGDTLLYTAVLRDDVKAIEALIAAKADLNKPGLHSGQTPIWLAADHGYENIVALLAKARANLNIPEMDGFTPVAAAALEGQTGIIKILAEAKADLDQPNEKHRTPACLAAAKNHSAVIQILFDGKADLSKTGFANMTPLHLAIAKSHYATIKILLNCGVKTNTRDEKNKLPLDYANKAVESFVILQMLKQYIETHLAGERPALAARQLDLIKNAEMDEKSDQHWPATLAAVMDIANEPAKTNPLLFTLKTDSTYLQWFTSSKTLIEGVSKALAEEKSSLKPE